MGNGRKDLKSSLINYQVPSKPGDWLPARILTLAKVSIERISVERWRTDTFTGLHTLFVRLAFVVAGAPFLSRRTETIVRISAIAVRADALMGPWQVYALCPVTTDLVTNDALVNICQIIYKNE